MPQSLTLNGTPIGYVLNESEALSFTPLRSEVAALRVAHNSASEERVRLEGRVSSLERINAALSERLRITEEQLRALVAAPAATAAAPAARRTRSRAGAPAVATEAGSPPSPAEPAVAAPVAPASPVLVPAAASSALSMAAGATAPVVASNGPVPAVVTAPPSLDDVRNRLIAFGQRHGIETARRLVHEIANVGAVAQIPENLLAPLIAAVNARMELPGGVPTAAAVG